jgi:hypothetical protein
MALRSNGKVLDALWVSGDASQRRAVDTPLRPDAEETRQFGLRSAVPRPDRTRTAVNPERNLPVLRKIAIIRLKFRVHPGNPGYTETPLYP